jgi:DNA-binding MarR family transcriptional regulator
MLRADITRVESTMPQPDYRALAELRYQIRRFLHFSEQAARNAHIEPHQHQFLLALKGLTQGLRPSIGTLADRLQIRPHSAVELVNRLVKSGFVRRRQDSEDGREVLLMLTAKGEAILCELSVHHRAELRSAGPTLMKALNAVLRPPGKAKIHKTKIHKAMSNKAKKVKEL